jgi:cyclophilin family peptidyl-prolyl cis-trans isomerase
MARRAKPPFPINLIWNVKFFYVTFIIVMIASLAATGLATGLGGSGGGGGAPIVDDDDVSPIPEETPTGTLTFDGPEDTIDASQPHRAIIKTDKGDIEIELATDAPEAVNNFAFLAGKGFYNDLTFFYVDKTYFSQTGDPTCESSGEYSCSGHGSPGYTLPLVEGNGSHVQWAVVAPAIVEEQEVHGSQFRILFNEDPRLDGKETVLGKVVNGQEKLEDLGDFVPCSVAQVDDCDPDPDMSSALVIEEVIVEPA